MNTNIKFSRKDFLKAVAATGFVASAAVRSIANPFERTHSIPSPMATNDSIAQEKKFVPVMITPFQENGKIDLNAVERLVDFYLAAGAKGLFANCLSSEMYYLSEEERLTLTRHVVKYVNGAVPVVATGSFGITMEERVEFAKKIYDTGINAVILISSHYAAKEESDTVLLNNIERMLELTGDIPMGLYECPSPYKRIIGPEVFKALLDTKRMIYHKDTSIDQEKVKAKLALIKDNPMEFYDAHAANTMFSLQHGAKGMSPIAGNFYPEIFVWMCNHATNPKKQEDVKWLQLELTKTEEMISKGYPMSSKYFLKKRGLNILPISRSTSQPLNAQQKETLDNAYKIFAGWCERLGINPVSM